MVLVLATRGFLWFLRFSSLQKIQHFKIPITEFVHEKPLRGNAIAYPMNSIIRFVVRSFVRSFVRSVGRSVVRWFVHEFIYFI